MPEPNKATAAEFDRFDAAMGHIATVPKPEVDKRIAREKRAKERKRKAE